MELSRYEKLVIRNVLVGRAKWIRDNPSPEALEDALIRKEDLFYADRLDGIAAKFDEELDKEVSDGNN